MTASYRNIWQVSYPLMLSGLAFTIINVTDAAFLGRVSEVALGAVGLGGIYYLIFLMAAVGLGIGAQIIMARLDGEGRKEAIGPVFDHLLYMMLAMAALLWGLHAVVTPTILTHVITSDAIREGLLSYLNVRVLGFLPAFLFLGYRAFLTGVSDTRAISYASAAMAGANVLLNYLLVFGKWGFPRMELEGAALASALSELIGLIFIVIWVKRKKMGEKFKCLRFPRPSSSTIASILDLGLPVMLQHVVALCSWLAFFTIIEGMGERPLAISNVSRSVYSVLMIPLIGISQATQTLVSNLLGQQRPDLLWLLVRRILTLSMACSMAVLLLNLIRPEFLLNIFTDDAELVQGSIPVIYMLSFCLLFFAFAMTLLAAVSGTGATKTALMIEVTTLLFYFAFTWATVNVWKWPLYMVWSAELVYFISIGLLATMYLWSGRWRRLVIVE
ncbi:MAG: MATE family efflux transporter [Flavobacteriales bacterium]|nr:MATE family efflux transporter [Flavobacteriales bacterium]